MSRSERSRPWKTIQSVFAEDTSILGKLAQRAAEFRRCEESLKSYLDTLEVSNLRVVAIEGGAIVAVVDSAAWSARLRFLAPTIIARAAKILNRPDLDRIEIRVRPPSPETLR